MHEFDQKPQTPQFWLVAKLCKLLYDLGMEQQIKNEAQKAEPQKQVIFSGIQPTGNLHIGNYLGAIKNMFDLTSDYDCLYCVVDMHAITVPQVPAKLRAQTQELLALYIACGLDPEKSTLFIQSHVSAHAELAWVLATLCYVGELSRMTQYKEKGRDSKAREGVGSGLMQYPVLMAADILLYKSNLVPVGHDQKQHLELARTLAERFNARYSETFPVPEIYMPKIGAKIRSLADPAKKMSKSDENENSCIYLTDAPDAVLRKFKRAQTDSGSEIKHDPANKPGVSNLLEIYSLLTNSTVKSCEKEFEGLGYGVLKQRAADAAIAFLQPIQARQRQILADKAYLEAVIKTGAAKAEARARRTLAAVYRKVGFLPKDFR